MYEKLNPEKTASMSLQKPVVENFVSIEEPIEDVEDNYKKKEGLLSPKSFFVIISGGEKRERQYFQLFSNIDNFGRIKIQFLADPKQLYPDGLLEMAISKQERYKTSQEDTNMFLLAEEILPLIDIELMKRIEENEQKNRLYQKVKSYRPHS